MSDVLTVKRRGATATAILEILGSRHASEVSLIELVGTTGLSAQSIRHAVNRLEKDSHVTTRMDTVEVPVSGATPNDFEPCLWGPDGTGERPNRKRCQSCGRGQPRYVWDPQPGRLTFPRGWVPQEERKRLAARLESAIEDGTFGIHVALAQTTRRVPTRLVTLVGPPLTNGQVLHNRRSSLDQQGRNTGLRPRSRGAAKSTVGPFISGTDRS
jgi:hypothetical protein